MKPLGTKARQSAIEALVIATDVYTWKLLRRDMGQGVAATVATVTGIIRSTSFIYSSTEGEPQVW